MKTRLLAFSDVHSSLHAFDKAMHFLRKHEVDAIIFAGDFASWNYDRSKGLLKEAEREYRIIRTMLEKLESSGLPAYFVWGNRDAYVFIDILGEKYDSPKLRDVFTIKLLDGLEGVNEVKEKTKMKSNINLYITHNKQETNRKTIYLTHYTSGVIKNALLHLEGHVHYGQMKNNYVNLGFLYRDDLHGATPLLGMVWIVEVDKRYNVEVKCYPLSEDLKEYACPTHSAEGIFILPNYWKKCPLCYNPNRAKFNHNFC